MTEGFVVANESYKEGVNNGEITAKMSENFKIDATCKEQLQCPEGNTKKLKDSEHMFLPSTLSSDDVPLIFREPHVLTGFRALGYSWSSYFLSVFQLHNESMNVWTHILALYFMLEKLIRFSSKIDIFFDPYSWPLLSGMICGMILYAFSAGAHCLQSKSELTHYTVFICDYSGIALYGLGSVIVHYYYCSEDSFYYITSGWFINAGVILAISIGICLGFAKVVFVRPYPAQRKLCQILPIVAIYILLISPICHRIILFTFYNYEWSDSMNLHLQQIMWFTISGFFFASEFPQRHWPGCFDIFFHSHQIFHIAIMLCTLIQMDATFLDYVTRGDYLRKRPTPTLLSSFGPVVITVFILFLNILFIHLHIRKRIAKNK